MKQRIKKNNKWTKKLKRWKEKQGIESLSIEDMEEVIKEQGDAVIEYKMDGQLAWFNFDGEKARFASLKGRIVEDLPVLEEFVSILRKHRVRSADITGEIVGLDEKGYPLRFNETMDLIRDPTEEEEKRIAFYPFEVIALDGKEFDNKDLDVYWENFQKLKKMAKGAKLVRPVYARRGGVDVLKKMWQEWAIEQKQEGLVIRTPDGKIYKVKTVYTFDVAIIFVKEGQKRLRGTLGAIGCALMDKNRIFRYAGLVGTGFTDEMRKELWDFAMKNKADIGDKDNYVHPHKVTEEIIWVKPKLVVQIKWKDIYPQYVEGYSYSKGKWFYEGDFEGVIMREPRFQRIRDDKEINPSDLRLTQIPDWSRLRKKIKEKEDEK